jgi:putative DNA primase/helicase
VAAVYGKVIRYSHAMKTWLCWDGQRWKVDYCGRVRQLAREVMVTFLHQAAGDSDDDKTRTFANSSCRSSAITGMLKMLEGELVIRTEELDADPDVLNVRNGTVDLRTGELRPHCREDYLTKLVHHDYNPTAECPTFHRFLSRITSHHPALAAYLQRAIGYGLTARTIEKALFLPHGNGSNGKSTLLTTILGIVEEYATLIQIDSIMDRELNNNSQSDLADLRGARFVMTSETKEGQFLSEAVVKRVTQGMGKIKAVRKYENPITFKETHKLWIDCNHRPRVRGQDNAIWNRLYLLPFDVSIPSGEQDKELPRKLAGESEGILAWAIAGAKLWYRDGLGRPPDIEHACAEWRNESDDIGRFLDECCLPFGEVSTEALYRRYEEWVADGGTAGACSKAIFRTKLLMRNGIEKRHAARGSLYRGVQLRKPGSGRVSLVGFTLRGKDDSQG